MNYILTLALAKVIFELDDEYRLIHPKYNKLVLRKRSVSDFQVW